MNWLARLKKIEATPEVDATKPTKGGSVGFVAPISVTVLKNEGATEAVNEPAPEPESPCQTPTLAMDAAEIDAYTGRLGIFTDQGLTLAEAEALAERLVKRDRECDERRTCLECAYILGTGTWRCGNWEVADVASGGLARELVLLLQRCDGFRTAQSKTADE